MNIFQRLILVLGGLLVGVLELTNIGAHSPSSLPDGWAFPIIVSVGFLYAGLRPIKK